MWKTPPSLCLSSQPLNASKQRLLVAVFSTGAGCGLTQKLSQKHVLTFGVLVDQRWLYKSRGAHQCFPQEAKANE
jgi:hypothetical protein